MRAFLILALACVSILGLGLSGCASVLKDLQGCERHYNGTVSGGAIQPAVMAGAALIDCCPVGYVSTVDHKGCEPKIAAPASSGS